MTCIEKLRELHPDWDEEKIKHYVEHYCVTHEYIMPRSFTCGAHGWEDGYDDDCEKHWNQDILDEAHNKHNCVVCLNGESMRRMARIAERVGYSRDEVVAAALLLYENGLNAIEESRNRVTGMSVNFELKGD